MSDLAALQQVLGITFNELSLLEQSLVHSSYLNENPDSAQTSNERLEFLGDAVLGLIVAEKIYQDFPQFNEGEMTRLRAAVVRRDALARMAVAINLGSYLYSSVKTIMLNLASIVFINVMLIDTYQSWDTKVVTDFEYPLKVMDTR